MKILISTDTSCIINQEGLDRFNISVFPLNVIIDGQEYLDGITINQDELAKAMRENKKIKTSTPPMGEVIEYFEKLFNQGYNQIIHFTISSQLSSMYDLFNNVSNNYFEGKVKVVDSYGLSSLMLSHILYTYDELNKGTSIEDIVNNIEERKKDNSVVFIPENLTALKNGGRISPAIAMIGNTLGLKPVISLKEGKLEKESMTRNSKKFFQEKIKEYSQKYKVDDYDYYIVSFDGKENVLNFVLECAKEILGENNFHQGILPINVCAHCGPGTIGLLVTPKINSKSISEF